MKHRTLQGALAALASGLLISAGCGDSFPHFASTSQLTVSLSGKEPVGTSAARLPLRFTGSDPFTVHIEAHNPDGSLDTTFTGYARMSIKPGTVVSLSGPNTEGRNVKLVGGVADGVEVDVVDVYGDARIWAEDIGYVPADPAGATPPECANGKDDNGNGLVDFPVDPGCAYANDNTEDGGSYASGATDVIHYSYPRIADIRGVGQGGGATPFPHEQVQLDTQWNGTTESTRYGVVVTRVASDGFYVTDLNEPRGYDSVFAYNYTAPPRMLVCDRLVSFGGTASDFFGFTEIGFPTWIVEEWDPSSRPCLVPEPHVFTLAEIASTPARLNQEAALVRVMQNPPGLSYDVHISHKFGPGYPMKDTTGAMCTPAGTPCYLLTPDATDCDFNRNGKIDFTGGDEQLCATNCQNDLECTEYSGFAGFSQFNLVIIDKGGSLKGTILANASTSATFDPVASKGMPLVAFTGTLRYFSGGTQFTIEARCDDDIVIDPTKSPLPSSPPWPPAPGTSGDTGAACVHARTISDINQY